MVYLYIFQVYSGANWGGVEMLKENSEELKEVIDHEIVAASLNC